MKTEHIKSLMVHVIRDQFYSFSDSVDGCCAALSSVYEPLLGLDEPRGLWGAEDSAFTIFRNCSQTFREKYCKWFLFCFLCSSSAGPITSQLRLLIGSDVQHAVCWFMFVCSGPPVFTYEQLCWLCFDSCRSSDLRAALDAELQSSRTALDQYSGSLSCSRTHPGSLKRTTAH